MQNNEDIEGADGEPNSEDFLPTPKPPPTKFELMPPKGSALPGAVIVALTSVACILSWGAPDRFDFFYVSRESIIKSHEYWRLFTALLGHGDMMHLLHNAPVYLFFAWILQGYFGLFASVVLPLVVGVVSNAVAVYFYDDHIKLLGASGMIFGMVGLWLVLYVHFDQGNWWVKRVMRAIGFSLMVLFPQTYDPKVSYLAHLSGFLAGILLGRLFLPIFVKMNPAASPISELADRGDKFS